MKTSRTSSEQLQDFSRGQNQWSAASTEQWIGQERQRVMDPCLLTLELLGMLVYMAAWLCALATTLMPQWLTMSTELLAIESYQQGLWETCVVQEVGGIECRRYDSLLGLPQDIMLARWLMCMSLALGLLGIMLAIPGLHMVKSCGQGPRGLRAKRCLKLLAGVLGMVAGVLSLIPASYVAHLTVEHFFDETVPEVVPRWEFGDALFCGWGAGFLLLVAGFLLVASCLGSMVDQSRGHLADSPRRYNIHNSSRRPPEYV